MWQDVAISLAAYTVMMSNWTFAGASGRPLGAALLLSGERVCITRATGGLRLPPSPLLLQLGLPFLSHLGALGF